MELKEFISDCLKGKCNRHTFLSKQCEKLYKIEKCFMKYNASIEKNKKKNEKKILDSIENWENKKQKFHNGEITKEEFFNVDKRLLEVYKEVDERDNNCCVFWNYILTVEQKVYIYKHFYNDFEILSKVIDHAHLDAISEKPELKYDKNNIVCLSRFFHSRLDQYKNLLTGCSISKEERQKYIDMFREYVKNVGI